MDINNWIEDSLAFHNFRKEHPAIRCDKCYFGKIKAPGSPRYYCSNTHTYVFCDGFCNYFIRKDERHDASK